jgi:hypothetical protein
VRNSRSVTRNDRNLGGWFDHSAQVAAAAVRQTSRAANKAVRQTASVVVVAVRQTSRLSSTAIRQTADAAQRAISETPRRAGTLIRRLTFRFGLTERHVPARRLATPIVQVGDDGVRVRGQRRRIHHPTTIPASANSRCDSLTCRSCRHPRALDSCARPTASAARVCGIAQSR